jgi:hypothetical protein
MRKHLVKTVAQAAREASRSANPVIHKSAWLSKISFGKNSKRKGSSSSGWHKNLTTTTAAGYTNAYDWLAKAMGQGPSFAGSWARQSPTGASATGVTGCPTTLPTAGQGLAGSIVVLFGSTNASLVYGVIMSNTGSAIVVDQWYDATSTSGASGTLPTGGTFYIIILPGQNPAAWMAVTSSSGPPTTADTYLAGELAGATGFSRAVGTYSHSAGTSTYSLVHLWTAGATETINMEAQFGAANGPNTTPGAALGVMPFESAEPNPPTLVSGDTLQNTCTITI